MREKKRVRLRTAFSATAATDHRQARGRLKDLQKGTKCGPHEAKRQDDGDDDARGKGRAPRGQQRLDFFFLRRQDPERGQRTEVEEHDGQIQQQHALACVVRVKQLRPIRWVVEVEQRRQVRRDERREGDRQVASRFVECACMCESV